MVSVIAKKIAIKRQHKGNKKKILSLKNKFKEIFSALCEVFDKADITRDGTISIAEYMALCEEYGVRLTKNDIDAVKNIADDDGEVGDTFTDTIGSVSSLGSQERLHSLHQEFPIA